MNFTYLPLRELSTWTGFPISLRRDTAEQARLEQSLSEHGLFHPLIVQPRGRYYAVIDGRKRLKVLRRLLQIDRRGKTVPKIPCVVQNEVPEPNFGSRPSLLTEPELAYKILDLIKQCVTFKEIAATFECDLSFVQDCAQLKRLHRRVLKAFYTETIGLAQAAALATISNPKAQWTLLEQLGPFVSNEEIFSAILEGETVLDLPDGNVIILPSRHAQKLIEFDSPIYEDLLLKKIAA